MHKVIKYVSKLIKRTERGAVNEKSTDFSFAVMLVPQPSFIVIFELINFMFYKMLHLQSEISIPQRHFFLSNKLFLGISVLFSTNPACLMGFSLFCATMQVWFVLPWNLAYSGWLNFKRDSTCILFGLIFISIK